MGFIVAAFVAIILGIFSIFFITLEIYVGIIGRLKGAPFVASRPRQIAVMIDMADIKEGMRVADLGSGDGSILIAAARRGAIATGIEMNPFLVLYSRWRTRRAGLQDRITFARGSIKDYPIGDVDVVFLYLLPSLLAKISVKLSSELKPGSRVISNGFPIANWTPLLYKDGIFLYRVS